MWLILVTVSRNMFLVQTKHPETISYSLYFFFFITDRYFRQSFLFDFVLSAILLDMGNIKQVTANI